MKTNPLNKGILTENAVGIGTVTGKMVRKRAIELAAINGRPSHEMSKIDMDQARRELTGGSDKDPNETMLESILEAARSDPVPGSIGHQAPKSPSEDEDDEGQSQSEQLVKEGVAEAEHDQMLQAAREAAKKD